MSRIDADLVRRWVHEATDALRRERAALDRVNVFPVADADTGTNMYLTLLEGQRAVSRATEPVDGAELLAVAARAALLGARGNSGVILSEWLRGASLAARREATAAEILLTAARSARAAVASPADGTILTTADAAATAALAARDRGDGTAGVSRAALDAARESARTSMTEHPVLAAAGVLDAGACGLVLVLGALVAAAMSDSPGTMTPVSLELVVDPPGAVPAAHATSPGTHCARTPDVAPPSHLELMFVLTRDLPDPGDVAPRLRDSLEQVGESVVVVGGDTGTGAAVWQAHVHTGDLPAALRVAALAARGGTLSQVHVRHLEAAGGTPWGVVAVTGAPALAAQLAHAGAVALLTGGLEADVEPTTPEDVGRAAASAGARRVLVLGDTASGEPTGADLDELVRLDTPTPVHQVVALAALETAANPRDPVPELRAVLAELRALGPLPAPAAPGALAEALDDSGALAVVTLLVDDGATRIVTELTELIAAAAPTAEIVALPTGRPGDEVWLGLEPVPGAHAAPLAHHATVPGPRPFTEGP